MVGGSEGQRHLGLVSLTETSENGAGYPENGVAYFGVITPYLGWVIPCFGIGTFVETRPWSVWSAGGHLILGCQTFWYSPAGISDTFKSSLCSYLRYVLGISVL